MPQNPPNIASFDQGEDGMYDPQFYDEFLNFGPEAKATEPSSAHPLSPNDYEEGSAESNNSSPMSSTGISPRRSGSLASSITMPHSDMGTSEGLDPRTPLFYPYFHQSDESLQQQTLNPAQMLVSAGQSTPEFSSGQTSPYGSPSPPYHGADGLSQSSMSQVNHLLAGTTTSSNLAYLSPMMPLPTTDMQVPALSGPVSPLSTVAPLQQDRVFSAMVTGGPPWPPSNPRQFDPFGLAGQAAFAPPNPAGFATTTTVTQPQQRVPPELRITFLTKNGSANRTRVETQVVCRLELLNKHEDHKKLVLPIYTLSKPKMVEKDRPKPPEANLLLHTRVVCTTPLQNLQCKQKALRSALEDAQRKVRGESVDERKEWEEKNCLPQDGGEVKICEPCKGRERTRDNRKKKPTNDDEEWLKYADDRVLIFNDKEFQDWMPPGKDKDQPRTELADHKTKSTKPREKPKLPPSLYDHIDMPMRITCYCRHHTEKIGYKVIMTILDFQGQLVAQALSDNIFITDDHKSSQAPNPQGEEGSTPDNRDHTDSPSPPSKKRRASRSTSSPREAQRLCPGLPGNPFPTTIASAGDSGPPAFQNAVSPFQFTSQHFSMDPIPMTQLLPHGRQDFNNSISPISRASSPHAATAQAVSPPNSQMNGLFSMTASVTPPPAIPSVIVVKVIPSEGPKAGGTEVCIVGKNFKSGMTVMFGETEALSTACWGSTTLVCTAPPSEQGKTVPVTIKDAYSNGPQCTYTYVDEEERFTNKLAFLQKMGGWGQNALSGFINLVPGGSMAQGGNSGFQSGNANPGGSNGYRARLQLPFHVPSPQAAVRGLASYVPSAIRPAGFAEVAEEQNDDDHEPPAYSDIYPPGADTGHLAEDLSPDFDTKPSTQSEAAALNGSEISVEEVPEAESSVTAAARHTDESTREIEYINLGPKDNISPELQEKLRQEQAIRRKRHPRDNNLYIIWVSLTLISFVIVLACCVAHRDILNSGFARLCFCRFTQIPALILVTIAVLWNRMPGISQAIVQPVLKTVGNVLAKHQQEVQQAVLQQGQQGAVILDQQAPAVIAELA